jgi:hypothetical protein
VNWTRATTRVPTHLATPPPPLRMSGLLRRIGKQLTGESGGGEVAGDLVPLNKYKMYKTQTIMNILERIAHPNVN